MLIVIAVDLCGHCCVPSTEGNRVPVSGGVQVFGHPLATRIQAEDAATPSDQDVPRVRALAEFLWKLNDVMCGTCITSLFFSLQLASASLIIDNRDVTVSIIYAGSPCACSPYLLLLCGGGGGGGGGGWERGYANAGRGCATWYECRVIMCYVILLFLESKPLVKNVTNCQGITFQHKPKHVLPAVRPSRGRKTHPGTAKRCLCDGAS